MKAVHEFGGSPWQEGDVISAAYLILGWFVL